MAVDVSLPRREFGGSIERWRRCRDVFEGEDAVKAAGEIYLPRLSGQTPARYNAYRKRATFYGAFARTVAGLGGAVFRKDPALAMPDTAKGIDLTDVTRTGVPFVGFAMQTLEEILKVGRFGVLVDMPASAPAGAPPYFVPVLAEQIINWQTSVINGLPVLTRVMISEEVEEADPGNPYQPGYTKQIRECRLNEAGAYEVLIHRKSPNGEWVAGASVIPTRGAKPLTAIPFVFFGPTSLEPTIQKPPLLDLVNINLSHYRTSADLEHGRHYCGLPQPWIAGYKGQDKFQIGSSVAWVFDDPQAKAEYLEFTGQGLGELKEALREKQDQMAILGARMLEGQKPGVEAAETVKLRSAGDSATLKGIATIASLGLSQVMRWCVWWSGIEVADKDVTVTLNTDFFGLRLTAEEVKALMLQWQSGGISFETYYDRLAEGGWTRPGVTAYEERDAINADRADEDPADPVIDPAADPMADAAGAGAR